MLAHRFMIPAPPSRVVVVGGSGFIGTDLVRQLRDRDMETVALASSDLDLCQPESIAALQRVIREDDALVILSAITPDKGKDLRTFMKNLAMGEHLSAALSRSSPAHVIYLSSDAVYAEDVNPVRERSCCSPSSFHGLMHLVRERMLTQALAPSRAPLLVLRPCALYGEGDPHQSYGPNRFLRTARDERRITLLGHGEEKRDHVWVQDLSRLLTLCLLHHSEGVLNVATGTSISFFDLARMIAGLCGHEVQIDCQPRRTPITHRHVDIAALVKAFPSFRLTPLRTGLATMAGPAMVHA